MKNMGHKILILVFGLFLIFGLSSCKSQEERDAINYISDVSKAIKPLSDIKINENNFEATEENINVQKDASNSYQLVYDELSKINVPEKYSNNHTQLCNCCKQYSDLFNSVADFCTNISKKSPSQIEAFKLKIQKDYDSISTQMENSMNYIKSLEKEYH